MRSNWRRRIVLLLLLLAHRALLELLGLLLGLGLLLRLDRRAGGLLWDPGALLTDMLAMLMVLLDESVVQRGRIRLERLRLLLAGVGRESEPLECKVFIRHVPWDAPVRPAKSFFACPG